MQNSSSSISAQEWVQVHNFQDEILCEVINEVDEVDEIDDAADGVEWIGMEWNGMERKGMSIIYVVVHGDTLRQMVTFEDFERQSSENRR